MRNGRLACRAVAGLAVAGFLWGAGTGCAVRWKEEGAGQLARDRMVGTVLQEASADGYRGRTSFGLTIDLVDGGIYLGVRRHEVVAPMDAGEKRPDLLMLTKATKREMRRQVFVVSSELVRGPRMERDVAAGLYAARCAVGTGGVGLGFSQTVGVAEVRGEESLLFVGEPGMGVGWSDLAGVRAWRWDSVE